MDAGHGFGSSLLWATGLFVLLAGWVTERYSYTPIFAAVGAMHIVSALIIMKMIPSIKQIKQ